MWDVLVIFVSSCDFELGIAKVWTFWPPDAKNWLIWKDPDAGKDWRWDVRECLTGGFLCAVSLFHICKSNRPNCGLLTSWSLGILELTTLMLLEVGFSGWYSLCLMFNKWDSHWPKASLCRYMQPFKKYFFIRPSCQWHGLSNVEFISSNQATCQ